MTDKVSYSLRSGEVLVTRESSIVPDKGDHIVILDDTVADRNVFEVTHVEYTITESNIVANVVVEVDEG